jgi:uncharacterized protein (DUF362 family)
MLQRREFLKQTAVLAGVMAGGIPLPATGQAADPEVGIAVVEGDNPAAQVREAVRLLGGIDRFVRRGERVVVLPNPQGTGRGVTTHPAIVGEIVRLCLGAGAASVSVSSCHGPEDWRGTGVIEAVDAAGGRMKYPDPDRDWVTRPIPKARAQKEVKVIRDALEADRLINLPIFKQHSYTRVTGCLKNLMGTNHHNWGFHKGDVYLHQAIVDLASLFTPTLCVVDATTILTDGGPFGPGRVAHPKRVYAGTDMVGLDALCCELLKVNPREVLHIQLAQESGMGQMSSAARGVKHVRI